MAKSSPSHLLVRIKAAQQPDRIEDLLRDQYSFGRGDADGSVRVDFVVPGDPALSREHCRLLKQDGGYVVENLSANGSFVNGKPVEAPQPLKNKDKIEIGSTTTIEYLVVTDTERAQLLKIETASEAKDRTDESATAKKSFFGSPMFIGMIVFYGIIGLVVASVVGEDQTTRVALPKAPFFTPLLEDPLDAGEAPENARATADRMWQETVRAHGGAVAKHGAHAYYLIRRARRILGLLGYATLGEAVEQGDPIAVAARDALNDLEKRVQSDVKLGQQLAKSRQWVPARRAFERIQAAVPDRYLPIRQYADYAVSQLRALK